MKVLDYSSLNKLFVVGDVHGEFEGLFHAIKRELPIEVEEEKHPKEIERLARKAEKEKRFKERLAELNRLNPMGEEGMDERHPVLETMRTSISKSMFKSGSRDNYLDSVIIVAGDCGFGFNSMEYYMTLLEKFNKTLTLANCHLLFVRGNHDDPDYFSEERINLSNIKTVQDYSVVKVGNKNILCVGGGLSVDRVWRWEQEDIINRFRKTNRKKLYWSGEMPIFNEAEIKSLSDNNLIINMVVTHTAPSFVFPAIKESSLGWLSKDKDLSKDITTERETLDKLYSSLKENKHEVKVWFYGHFHQNNDSEYENVVFKLCGSSLGIHNAFRLYDKAVMDKSNSELINSLYSKLLSSNIKMTTDYANQIITYEAPLQFNTRTMPLNNQENRIGYHRVIGENEVVPMRWDERAEQANDVDENAPLRWMDYDEGNNADDGIDEENNALAIF